jgi:hypothetical protein
MLQEGRDPLGIADVGLAPRDGLHACARR